MYSWNALVRTISSPAACSPARAGDMRFGASRRSVSVLQSRTHRRTSTAVRLAALAAVATSIKAGQEQMAVQAADTSRITPRSASPNRH